MSLQEGTIEFDPPLPKRKQQAIDALGFGRLNKVALLFPHAFWATHIDTFGRMHESPERRGEFFLFYRCAAEIGNSWAEDRRWEDQHLSCSPFG
jgi:hypothetical protein